MNTITKIILYASCVVCFAVSVCGICVGIGQIIYRDAKTPVEWCVERIKEKSLFKENGVTKYAYTANEAKYDGKRTYFVSIIYEAFTEDWYETWCCLIDYRNPFFDTVRECDVISVDCTRIARGIV